METPEFKTALAVEPVGSRVTCDPAPTDTDADFLVWTGGKVAEFREEAEAAGYECTTVEGDYFHEGPAGFLTFRKGEVNLIATDSTDFFLRFMAATSVAKRFNLLNKADRVCLFEAVLYGKECE